MGLERCSEIKSTGCSDRGPEFGSQHPCGGLWLSVTPVPGDPISSPGLCRTRYAYGVHTYIHTNTLTHKINLFFKTVTENYTGS